ncbi:YcaO-like family protein [Nocardioides anomalus]|uniref:YcaO-like family protein n=1 Tax=Nocardioides anomalus TaxID=2712223 RepID=A0A6G6W8W3_9ACTN|nr:YcaO-like family protein [Nocardioides anomalus]QIG41778.1 YcaO-like family protein [Nocardioides anomalus]
MTDSAETGLSDVVGAYTEVLGRFGTVVDFRIDALDRTGLPVTSCSLLVDGALTHHGNGYAATPEAARVGGLGELVEGVVGAQGVARLRRAAETGSRRDLVRRYGAEGVVDPRTLALPAGADWSEDRPVEWVTFADVRTGAPVRVPVEMAASDAGELAGAPAPLLPPVTNGLGAGLDADRAVAHGIGEVLQRHTNGLRFRALDRLSPVVPEEGLPPAVLDLLGRLRASGIDPVLKLAASELGVCSTYAVARDEAPADKIVVTACGEAAHPDPATSLVKALLELANSRARKAFCFGRADAARALMPAAYRDHLDPHPGDERAVAAMRGWAELPTAELADLVAPDTSRTTTVAALTPPGPALTDPSPAGTLAHLLAALDGHDVLAAVTEVDGVVAAKVLVTGLDVETLSHGRIGEHGVRTSLEHDLDLVRLGPAPVGEHDARVHLSEETQERLGGPAWFSYPAADRIVGPLYSLYREPGRHSVEV